MRRPAHCARSNHYELAYSLCAPYSLCAGFSAPYSLCAGFSARDMLEGIPQLAASVTYSLWLYYSGGRGAGVTTYSLLLTTHHSPLTTYYLLLTTLLQVPEAEELALHGEANARMRRLALLPTDPAAPLDAGQAAPDGWEAPEGQTAPGGWEAAPHGAGAPLDFGVGHEPEAGAVVAPIAASVAEAAGEAEAAVAAAEGEAAGRAAFTLGAGDANRLTLARLAGRLAGRAALPLWLLLWLSLLLLWAAL